MHPEHEARLKMTRRTLLGRGGRGFGAAALGSLLAHDVFAQDSEPKPSGRGFLGAPHFTPKARRVIFLFQSGAPSQIDLFDYKPRLKEWHGDELPDSVRMGQRLTGMTSGQTAFPIASSIFKFAQHGQSGAWVSELMPHTAKVVDDLCFIKTVHTEAINHDPAITYIQTGNQQPGRPCMGSWVSYGLGSENDSLPAFIVLISQGSAKRGAQALFARLWGTGFLPSVHQGVKLRSVGDPVLDISNPAGIDPASRRRMLDGVSRLNSMRFDAVGDPEIETRIAQYEMAYRMQTSVPGLTDLSDEPDRIFDLYGPDSRKPGTYAANCLLARRLAERDVRFIQLYHRGWDQHGDLPRDLALQSKDTDQASAALIADLKQRGLLDDTLVIWAGEFGRTVYSQGPLTPTNYGRDHHPRCWTIWMAGGGVRPGFTYGQTDDHCYNIVQDPVHVNDLQATALHLLGIDHERLIYRYQGRRYRLTDVAGEVVRPALA